MSEKRKLDFRLVPADQVGDALAGSARERPAERAVTSIEEEVAIAGAPDQGHIAGCGRAQARPAGRLGKISGPGKEFLDAFDDRPAARLVERRVVPGQFRGTGRTQAVAQP